MQSPTGALKRRTRVSRWGIIGRNIIHNLGLKLRTKAGFISTTHGASHISFSLDQSLDYIRTVFDEYLAYAGLRPEALEGKRILEVGPGDNLGVALLFLAHGASQVVCLDRFRPIRDEAHERRIYLALRDSLSSVQRERFDAAVRIGGSTTEFNPTRLQALYGVPVEQAPSRLQPQSFDLIVSRAVLMEFSEPGTAFAAMDRLLKPGGIAIHKVAPLNDYQMFRQHGHHPLEFLTVPGWLYNAMVTDSGKPNRRLVDYYRSLFSAPAYDAAFHVVRLLGSTQRFPPGVTSLPTATEEYGRALDLAQQIRPRLSREFRHATDEALVLEDLFIVARKTQPQSQPAAPRSQDPLCQRQTA